MKKYFIYLMIYSVGGFILERFINLIFIGSMYDNSVLIGPYQPLYGAGVLMAILVYDFFLKEIKNNYLKYGLLLLVAIITTGISEAVTGYGMEFFYDKHLWNYQDYFPLSLVYVGIIPTTLFGIASFLVIVFVHPFFETYIDTLRKNVLHTLFYVLFIVFSIDVLYTFLFRL